MIVAWLFPLPFAYQTKLYLDTSVIIASIMLFDPGVAILVAATGTIVAHALRRRTAAESIFNAAQTALQAAIQEDQSRLSEPGRGADRSACADHPPED